VNEVRAQVIVAVEPTAAFEAFTADVDRWWRRGERYGGTDVLGHRFEPGVGGRFVQILADREAPLGDILVWEPPHRLAFSWRQKNWLPGEITRVEVTFTPVAEGTEVVLRHHGFAQVVSDVGCDVGYAAGWSELVGWFAESLGTPALEAASLKAASLEAASLKPEVNA
jgi:uncharacterized protein YndB with AHSA1/START domain